MATEFDLDGSGEVDNGDVEFLVENIIGTFMGDANLDGKVDAMDLNQVGINWRRMDGVGWSNGDFTGDGAVNAADLNLIGVNWRSGVAAAALSGRVPRAPLAAAHAVSPTVVDEAIVRVSRDLSSKPDGTTSVLIHERPVDDARALSRSRYDVAKSRRSLLPQDDSLTEPEDGKALQLIDELFRRM
jgi:hypothetical protein